MTFVTVRVSFHVIESAVTFFRTTVPLAFVLSRYTNLYVIWLFLIVQGADLIKCVIGVVLVKKGVWMQNIVKT